LTWQLTSPESLIYKPSYRIYYFTKEQNVSKRRQNGFTKAFKNRSKQMKQRKSIPEGA
jgi:hypothetical protein